MNIRFTLPYKIKAFTLAEVLITLVIIGVIAAITVPTLMNNTNAQEYRSALKKAISAANQALELHYALEGVGAQDYSSRTDLINEVFKKRMSVMEVESSSSGQSNARASSFEYFIEDYYLKGENNFECVPQTGQYSNFFITQDGVLFCIEYWQNGGVWFSEEYEEERPCNAYNTVPCSDDVSYPNLYIDVNGVKKPNSATTSPSRPRDQYTAQIYNTKVVPFGDVTQSVMYDAGVSGAGGKASN